MNFNLHFGKLYSDNSINDKNNMFENYISKCYKVKRILISFNCFSEYTFRHVPGPLSHFTFNLSHQMDTPFTICVQLAMWLRKKYVRIPHNAFNLRNYSDPRGRQQSIHTI